MNYILISNYFPKNKYCFISGIPLGIAKNPYRSIGNKKKSCLNTLDGQLWEYVITLPDTTPNLKDLIVYHSFITNNYQTFHYAERAYKLLFEETELSFLTYDDSFLKNKGRVYFEDFKKFPICLSCKYISESEKKIEFIDYRNGFDKFLEMKTKKFNGYNLYNLISLFEFARSFDLTNRIYRNTHLSLSFYITILEALIGKPEHCSTIYCNKCNSNIPHSKISLEKHFKSYFDNFKDFRSLRHKTFHVGDFFNFWEYHSDLLLYKTDWENDEKRGFYMDKRELLECTIRVLLISEFYNFYKGM